MPWLVQGNHWVLVVAELESHYIQVLDSRGHAATGDEPDLEVLRKFTPQQRSRVEAVVKAFVPHHPCLWEVPFLSDQQCQHDESSCALFVANYGLGVLQHTTAAPQQWWPTPRPLTRTALSLELARLLADAPPQVQQAVQAERTRRHM